MTSISKPKFMDSKYALPVEEYSLDSDAPQRIKDLFDKFLSDETLTDHELTELYSCEYFDSETVSWEALPGAPQEIIDEVKWYNETILTPCVKPVTINGEKREMVRD